MGNPAHVFLCFLVYDSLIKNSPLYHAIAILTFREGICTYKARSDAVPFRSYHGVPNELKKSIPEFQEECAHDTFTYNTARSYRNCF
ncbi:hypothetical protein KSF_111370 [Reticulibacter mediterranei]|uniref:Uncharacterized protein n=1 Tax=Reticulibacter mediterranei TaxID=2778369 RepID=A0A8J3J000_9CHLR|nr:hypothetical protein KSF_111370 [Reticulibacter mediterranei]